MTFRRPQKTPLERALREAERSVAGALFLLFSAPDPESKADLRARFAAGLCSTLIVQKQLTRRQVEAQLNPSVQEVFATLAPDQVPSPESLWGPWLKDRETAATLGTWLELGSRYVAEQLQGVEPETVDWGRRDQEMLELFTGFPGATELDFQAGLLRIVQSGKATAQAPLAVLGSYQAELKSYLAGWADPQVPPAARPLPIFGCASRLFRLEWVDARSEARRAAQLGRYRYVYEHTGEDRLFLGLHRLESLSTPSAFHDSDFQEEMLARIETALKAAERLEPTRVKGLLKSKSQEIERLLPLAQGNAALGHKLSRAAKLFKTLADGIDTHLVLGLGRSSVSGRDKERLRNELGQLRAEWNR